MGNKAILFLSRVIYKDEWGRFIENVVRPVDQYGAGYIMNGKNTFF